MKQADIIKQLTNKQIRQQLYITQGFFILLSYILSLFLFSSLLDWFIYIHWDIKEIVFYGIAPAILLVIIEIFMYERMDPKHFDDGGINERVFKGQKIRYIFLIALIVAIGEEMLFRGILQTSFGYILASLIFALIHVRYLKKPFLLIGVLITSFGIGFLFELTQNLLVTISFHFIVDFLLGVYIKVRK